MSTQYIVQGRNVYLTNSQDRPAPLDQLPLGHYTLVFDMEAGYFLKKAEPFAMPPKLYGSTALRAKRFLTTFEDRPNTTGILLYGQKGSGKSLEMMHTCNQAVNAGYSTIRVNFAASGPAFAEFLKSIKEPIVLVIDEFEKVYSDKDQIGLLSLLDGTYSSKKLFILTCNEKNKVNNYMLNRPGRIFYTVEYKGLDADFIRDYCNDKLDDMSKMDAIVKLGGIMGDFTFDMLKAVVEEHNRYPEESLKDILKILNVNLDYASRSYYDVEYIYDGKKLENGTINGINVTVSPTSVSNPFLEESIEMSTYIYDRNEGTEEELEAVFDLTADTVVVDRNMDRIEAISTDGKCKAIIKRQVPKAFGYSRLF